MTIKQIINNPHRIPPHTFEEVHKNEYSSIIIYEENGKYGVTNDKGGTVLPFEYDNITVLGFDLLLLVQKGKMGILHVKRDLDKPQEEFKIAKIIPCEYDRISSPYHEEIVIMEKDTMYGMEVNLYFTYTEEMTDSYCGYTLLNRDIIEVTSLKSRHLYDARTGKIFFTSDKQRFAYSIFEVSGGTAKEYDKHNYDKTDLIIYDAYDMKNDLSCFIYYNGEETSEFVFEGEPYMIFDFRCYEGNSPLVKQLIVKKDYELIVLDDKCNPIATLADRKITLKNRLECSSFDGINANIICQSQKIKLESEGSYLPF